MRRIFQGNNAISAAIYCSYQLTANQWFVNPIFYDLPALNNAGLIPIIGVNMKAQGLLSAFYQ
jgi:hypothetical protein